VKSISKILALTLVLGVISFTAATAKTPASNTAPTAAAAVEEQPHMEAALKSLKEAREHLQQAEADKGGHRAAAIKATDEAIKHTEMGMKYADNHKDKDKDHDHDHDKK
jgi:hypothetical protein